MSEQAPEVITATPPAKKEKDPKKVAAGQALAAYNKAAKEAQLERIKTLAEMEERHAAREAEREAARAALPAAKESLVSNQTLFLLGLGAGGLLLYTQRKTIRKWLAGWVSESNDPMSLPVHVVHEPPKPTPKRGPAPLFNQSSAYN